MSEVATTVGQDLARRAERLMRAVVQAKASSGAVTAPGSPQGAVNFRGVGGVPGLGGAVVRPGVVFRSGSLDGLTPLGWEQLTSLGVRTVIDLRSPAESTAAPTRPTEHQEVVNLPMWQEPTGAAAFTEEQRSGLHARQVDQDRTLSAMHRLEAALAEAAPRREGPWLDAVLGALADLEAVTAEELANAERADSLLSDLSRSQPRMRNRARSLRLQYVKIRETIAAIRQDLEGNGDDVDVADARQRLGWALAALRHQRARESDLIYEAYYDAFRHELRSAGPGAATS